jgi:tripartite ATP-independent transporter DctM subunit
MSLFLLLDLVGMIVLMMLGVPVVMAVLGAALVYFLGYGELSTLVMMQNVQTTVRSFPLLAIPFFVLAGTVMAYGGIASRIMEFANVMVGHWRGGLAQVGVLNSFVMGSMSGSAVADAAVDSRILVPQMRRFGYSLGFSAAVSASSSVIAPILPPSTSLILYGLLGQVSVASLFLGGVVPALMIAVGLMLTVAIIARVRNYGSVREAAASTAQRLIALKDAFWALMMPVLLIGGLRSGLFTITELAVVAAVYTTLVSVFIYRSITLADFWMIAKETTRTTSSVLVIIAASGAFSYIFAIEQVPAHVIGMLSSVSDNPLIVMGLVAMGLVVLGMIVEGAAIMILAAPLLVSIANFFGIDPVHMGVMVVMVLTISTLTPPVGIVLFTVCSLTGCRIGEFLKEMLPFFATLLAILALVAVFPQLVLFLPDWLQ